MDKDKLKSEVPYSIADDPRVIKSVSWYPMHGDEWWEVGKMLGFRGVITRIMPYEENGHGACVPWVAAFVDDKLVARADCTGSTIYYK